MKKLTPYLVFAIFLTILSVIIGGIMKKAAEKISTEKLIASFPSFALPSLTGAVFSSESINQGPVLVLMYHPDCEHCQYELSEITKSNLPSRVSKLLLIANADCTEVQKFLGNFNLPGDQKVIPLLDTFGIVGKLFGAELIPSCYIYDKHLKLVKALHGEYRIESIFKYLQGSEQN